MSIKPKKKICIDCGEESYIWAHGRCRSCDAKYRSNKVGFKPDYDIEKGVSEYISQLKLNID